MAPSSPEKRVTDISPSLVRPSSNNAMEGSINQRSSSSSLSSSNSSYSLRDSITIDIVDSVAIVSSEVEVERSTTLITDIHNTTTKDNKVVTPVDVLIAPKEKTIAKAFGSDVRVEGLTTLPSHVMPKSPTNVPLLLATSTSAVPSSSTIKVLPPNVSYSTSTTSLHSTPSVPPPASVAPIPRSLVDIAHSMGLSADHIATPLSAEIIRFVGKIDAKEAKLNRS